MGKYLLDLVVSKDFFKQDPKSTNQKQKEINCTSSKLNASGH